MSESDGEALAALDAMLDRLRGEYASSWTMDDVRHVAACLVLDPPAVPDSEIMQRVGPFPPTEFMHQVLVLVERWHRGGTSPLDA